MSHTTYCRICGAIFLAVAMAHLARLILGWEIEIAGWPVPMWVSVPGLLVPGVLSAWGFRLASRS